MDSIIQLANISKDFRILNRHEGLKGSLRDLFSRDYSTLHAVHDVSLDIQTGEIVGYLGPNGAGKSTTIKMMTGVLEPTSGSILVNGRVPYKNRVLNAQNIGVVFGQRTQLWWILPVIESFRILKDMYRISDQQYNDMLDLYDSLLDVGKLYHKPVRQMSLGQRTLCDILAAFLHNPPIVFLDEPTIGLDVAMKSKIRELIRKLNQEKNTTVILTTHDMGDVDALCKRVIIIDKGKKLFDDNVEKLKSFYGKYRTLKVTCHENEEKWEDTLGIKELEKVLKNGLPEADDISVFWEDGWANIVINEKKVSLMEVLNLIQSVSRVKDVKIEEILIETVIRKIYEGEKR